MITNHPTAEVLQEFSHLQRALMSAGSPSAIGNILCRALRSVPGVAGSAYYDRKAVLAHELTLNTIEQSWPPPLSGISTVGDRSGQEDQSVAIFPIQTKARRVGTLLLVLSDRQVAAPYFESIENTASLAALLVQNQEPLRWSECWGPDCEAIMEAIADPVIFADLDRKIVKINQAFADQFGYDRKEASGRTTEFLYAGPEEYSKQGQEHFGKGAKGAYPLFESEYRRKDGSSFLAETLVSQVRSQDGEPLGYLGIIRDISERKAAERTICEQVSELKAARERLQESEERFKTLSAASHGGVIIHDKGRILDCNEALSRITGFSTEELIGMDGLELIAPESLAEVKQNISQGYDRRYDVKGVRADGSVYPLSIKGGNVGRDGREVRVIEFSDLTEIREAQEALRKSEGRLLQAHKMEAVGTLAGGIAHDFNNILSVIIGNAELATMDAPPGGQLADDLERITRAANRAKDLVGQILAFSRRSKVETIPLQLGSLIRESITMLRASLPATIEIQDHIDANCGTVLADRTSVYQIIMNLSTNASHAMEPSGGTLTVGLQQVDLPLGGQLVDASLEPGSYVRLTVSDTGSGMEPQIVDRIFEPYFTTKEVGKGTGMGLAIVHGIVAGYGGTIEVESELEAGTTVHVFFPVAGPQDLPRSVEQVTSGAGLQGTGSILLVDDEEDIVALNQKILTKLGYEVTAFRDSLEALAAFKNNSAAYDAVVTDQTMPGMTGADMARAILQIRPNMPIILCTGFSNLVNEQSAKAIGIKEFIQKPVSCQALAELVQKVLNQSGSRAET